MRYAFLAAVLAAVGCGPLQQPMPARLDDQSQKEVDAAWGAALTPVDKYDRRRWLDALVGTHAYQAGVDTFTLRSEKVLATGRVVMEVHTDRARPDDDRFVVTVFDAAGAVARQALPQSWWRSFLSCAKVFRFRRGGSPLVSHPSPEQFHPGSAEHLPFNPF